MESDISVVVILAYLLIFGVAAAIFALLLNYFQNRRDEATSKRIVELENKAAEEPQKVKPAWDLARVTLEAYFNKNLSQVTAIFWLCVAVMIAGFGIIVWGIEQAIIASNNTLPSIITGLTGVLTELIGATFLFIYRSTMEQAANYTKTLERINSVGMAMQILDTIPDNDNAKEDSLKNSTKAAVVKMLMSQVFEMEKPNAAPPEKE